MTLPKYTMIVSANDDIHAIIKTVCPILNPHNTIAYVILVTKYNQALYYEATSSPSITNTSSMNNS